MAKRALVAGAGGGFGGAMATALRAAGWEVQAYARGSDMGAAAKGADVIVNGLNPPRYHAWDRLIPEITETVLAAARFSGARVLVPDNVYVYGSQPGPWNAGTPHRPVSRKGTIRAAMEARYREATEKAQARVLILRGGDFIRTSTTEGIFPEVVLKPLSKGRIVALGDPDAARAHAFLPDMARAGAALLGQDGPAFLDMPFAGHTFSMRDLARAIGQVTGAEPQVTRFPWWQLRLLSPVWELARELGEMRYLYDLPHALDPAPLQAALPGFAVTPFDTVVRAMLGPR
ncbi:epimerase [Rhodobacter sp. Har01]|uniref:epimerase n=1 Tax=Rhodobacter sp. Har01 TaxID=2883999 RepID=UPI001D08B52C|nr:epimerase [Rhodobacter sp. Har01]MCB6179357.1 epimerase [Rhodobacter sp. Har01]